MEFPIKKIRRPRRQAVVVSLVGKAGSVQDSVEYVAMSGVLVWFQIGQTGHVRRHSCNLLEVELELRDATTWTELSIFCRYMMFDSFNFPETLKAMKIKLSRIRAINGTTRSPNTTGALVALFRSDRAISQWAVQGVSLCGRTVIHIWVAPTFSYCSYDAMILQKLNIALRTRLYSRVLLRSISLIFTI